MKVDNNVELMGEDFLLENEVAHRLYHKNTATMLVFDDDTSRRDDSGGVLPQCAALPI